MALGDGNLVPDRIPDWLKESVRHSKGRSLDDFHMLDEFYKESQVIKSDRFDRSTFKTMRSKAAELDDLAKSRHVDKPTFENIIEDEFLGMFKSMPKKRGEKEMRPTHRVNHAAMNKAMDTREWNELLTYTQLDEWASTMASVDFGLKLAEIFDEMDELMEMQKKVEEEDDKVAQAIQDLQDQLGGNTPQDEIDEALQALQDALKPYEEATDGVDRTIKSNSNALRQAGRKAAEHAKDQTEGTEALLDSFGTEPGALSRMDAQARMELAARIRQNQSLKELAEKVGRFIRLAMSEQAQKIVHGIDEIHDIEMGNDIHKVLPSDLALLTDDDLDILFLKKYADRELLQYQLRGVEKVSRGAIICMIDSSGSMYGARDTWARAVGIALLHIAYKQSRDFYGIIFSSGYDSLIEFNFPKGIAQPTQVLDFAEAGYHGGTDFELPVTRGVEILESQFNDEGSQKGDLVMVTDGECAVHEEWLARYHNNKDFLGFRMYSCLIGTQSATLNQMSDEIYHITQFAQGSDVQSMFGYI